MKFKGILIIMLILTNIMLPSFQVKATIIYLTENFEDISDWTKKTGGGGTIATSSVEKYAGNSSVLVTTATIPQYAYIYIAMTEASGDFHFQAYIYVNSSILPSQCLIVNFFDVSNSRSTIRAYLNYTESATYLINQAGATTYSNVGIITMDQWVKLDFFFVDSTGKVWYYIDNSKKGSFTGYGSYDSDPDRIYLGDTSDVVGVAKYYLDELIVDDMALPSNTNIQYSNYTLNETKVYKGESVTITSKAYQEWGGINKVWLETNETGQWFNYSSPYNIASFSYETLLQNMEKYSGNPFSTPTYDGSNQTVHPDVLIFDEPWNGYKYWMAMTPYPNGDSVKENPSILVSNDYLNWIVPAGLTNPIDPAPGSGKHNSDPDLYYNQTTDTLWCYYRETSLTYNYDIIQRRSSTDGITWSTEETVYTSIYGETVSPAILIIGSVMYMWVINVTSTPYCISLLNSTDNGSTWSMENDNICDTAPDGAGRDIWHLDVIYYNSTYWMHVITTTAGTTGDATKAYYGKSVDGITWTWGTNFIPNGATGTWDVDRMYRGSLVISNETDLFLVQDFYSARDATNWRIGLTQQFASLHIRIDVSNVANTWNWYNFTWSSNQPHSGDIIGFRIVYQDLDGNQNRTELYTLKIGWSSKIMGIANNYISKLIMTAKDEIRYVNHR